MLDCDHGCLALHMLHVNSVLSAIYWLGYESTKGYYMRNYGTGDPGMMVTFLGGAVSGTVSATELYHILFTLLYDF